MPTAATKPQSAFDRWDGRFYYYALVKRGGNTVGKRLGVRMAILTDCTFADGKLVTARGFVGTAKLTGWTKAKREVNPADIVKSWRSCPTTAAIAKEKRKLPVATEADELWRGHVSRPSAPTACAEANPDQNDRSDSSAEDDVRVEAFLAEAEPAATVPQQAQLQQADAGESGEVVHRPEMALVPPHNDDKTARIVWSDNKVNDIVFSVRAGFIATVGLPLKCEEPHWFIEIFATQVDAVAAVLSYRNNFLRWAA